MAGLFLTVLGWLLASTLTLTLGKWIAGDMRMIGFVNGTHIESETELHLYRLLRGLQSLVMWGLPGALWWLIVRRNIPRTKNSVTGRRLLWNALAGAALMVAALPLMQNLVIPSAWFAAGGDTWVQVQEAAHADAIRTAIGGSGVAGILLNVVVLCLLPAVAEEIFFRGAMQGVALRMMKPLPAVLVTAAVFSAVHFQFLGFISRFALGALLGWFAVRNGSLWVSIVAHFCFNGVNLLLARLAVTGHLPESFLSPDYRFHWAWVAASVALLGAGVVWMLKKAPTAS